VQKEVVQQKLAAVRKSKQIPEEVRICIDVEPAGDFYRAEEYHQKFYLKQSLRRSGNL
jgi:peptide methionine sulfoxide reductase MsrA